MGVPSYFRWLVKRFPKIMVNVKEAKEAIGAAPGGGNGIAHDTSLPNPNEREFDNLYLDMNGIIHPCSHPEDREAPATEEDMFMEIFMYIDRLFSVVRPRKLLYLAIDGVAPRAKINQQRSRRFRAARDAMLKEEEERITDEPETAKCFVQTPAFDSNVITPGTPFMDRLAKALRHYAMDRLNSDPGWKGVKVMLSDASVPGEGEHKIMEYIRLQRSQPHHDPNTVHVLYGLDADLIQLGLATHEPHFCILREEVPIGRPNQCFKCQKVGHKSRDCPGKVMMEADEKGHFPPIHSSKIFQFLEIPILREYLRAEFEPAWQYAKFPFDIERIVDDYVLINFFVGNDFIPHLPHLEIRDGALNDLIRAYRDIVPNLDGYLTQHGEVFWERAQQIIDRVSLNEPQVFRNRKAKADRAAARERGWARQAQSRVRRDVKEVSEKNLPKGVAAARPGAVLDNAGYDALPAETPRKIAIPLVPEVPPPVPLGRNAVEARDAANKAAAARLRALKKTTRKHEREEEEKEVATKKVKKEDEEQDKEAVKNAEEEKESEGKKHARDEEEINTKTIKSSTGEAIPVALTPTPQPKEKEEPDEVRLHEAGYQERYYQAKFQKTWRDREFLAKLVQSYQEGLVWVFRYYYQGCKSWSWYYPYHYAPFASDLKNLAESAKKIRFDMGKPFRPFEQLMGVFPPYSAHALPTAYRELMVDEKYGITDFYPEDFTIDLNGKKFEWQGVALLPFIDEKRLKVPVKIGKGDGGRKTQEAIARVRDTLTEEELRRDSHGPPRIFCHKDSALGKQLVAFMKGEEEVLTIVAEHAEGLGGFVQRDPNFLALDSSHPAPCAGMEPIAHNAVVSAIYNNPAVRPGHVFVADLLPGAVLPAPKLTEFELNPLRAQHHREKGRYGGYNPTGDQQLQRGYHHHRRTYEYSDPARNQPKMQPRSYEQQHWQYNPAPFAGGGRQYRQPPRPMYGQPPAVYGQPPAVYGQPPAVYGQPPAVYGQPPAMYGQPPAVYGQATYGQPPAPMQGHPQRPMSYGQPPAPVYGQATYGQAPAPTYGLPPKQ